MPNSHHLTLTDIANMAIDWCGGSLSISNIDDQNPDAMVCKRNIHQAIVTELDKYEWAFARKTVIAIEDTSEENKIPGYEHCYVLPEDFSRLSMYTAFEHMCMPPVSEYQPMHSYLIQNGRLYTHSKIKHLCYNSNNVPIDKWPALFADIVALNLAERIAGKLRGMDADISFINSLRKDKLKDARRLELIQTEAQQGGFSTLHVNRRIP